MDKFMGKYVDYGEKLFLILLALPFLAAFAAVLPTQPYSLALAAAEMLSVVLILIRAPGVMSVSFYAVAIAFIGTALPLLARPGGTSVISAEAGGVVMFAGLAISIAAKLALNRSFGVVAANRGVKSGGPYRLVRHPMYFGYIVTQVGFLLLNFSLTLIALYLVAWTAQLLRVIEEERVLTLDPAYGRFALATRWRVVPGLF